MKICFSVVSPQLRKSGRIPPAKPANVPLNPLKFRYSWEIPAKFPLKLLKTYFFLFVVSIITFLMYRGVQKTWIGGRIHVFLFRYDSRQTSGNFRRLLPSLFFSSWDLWDAREESKAFKSNFLYICFCIFFVFVLYFSIISTSPNRPTRLYPDKNMHSKNQEDLGQSKETNWTI